MQKEFNFIVSTELSNLRLDKFLADNFEVQQHGLSRGKIKHLILQGYVIFNSIQEYSPRKLVKCGDQITLFVVEEKPSKIKATKIKLNIIYEDEDLLVVNKQAGLTTHPGNGNRENTLVNALLAYNPDKLSDIGGDERPGIVHRLDKNTSGLMMVAKNNFAHIALSNQLQNRTLKREYIALVWGMLRPDCGVIKANIARSSKNRKLMDISESKGKVAITHYITEEIFCAGLLSLVKCNLETGRTHQIRVHMSNLKHGVFGDPEYGHNSRKLKKYFDIEKYPELFSFKRQALHARKIVFQHPRSKKEMSFFVDIPDDFQKILFELQNVAI